MSFSWAAAQADMRAIRKENEVSIALRRDATTLTAQLMRIEIAGARGMQLQSDAARQAQQAAFILGEHDMDIALGDRLNHVNILLKVVFVQPNRLACTIAEAVVVE
jgi:hypothetical protein